MQILLLVVVSEKHLQTADYQNEAEEIQHEPKAVHNGNPQKNEKKTQNDGAGNAVGKAAVLIRHGNIKGHENCHENKKIIHAQTVFD